MRVQKEIHSAELPTTPLPEMDMSDLDVDAKPDILVADPELLKQRAKTDYLDELAFNEEFMTIYLYRGSEEFAPDAHQFWVNGKGVTVPVEQKVMIRRKYVEIMARSQPFKIKTTVIKPAAGNENDGVKNLWQRYKSDQFPFTVIQDKNPLGAAWLEGIRREAN